MSGSAGSFGWGVTVSRRTTDGTYPINSNDRRSLAGASLRFAPDARGEARLSVRYADALFHFPTDATGQVADSDQHTSDRGPSVALEIARTFSARWDAAASLAWHREESRYDDGADSPGDTIGVLLLPQPRRVAAARGRGTGQRAPISGRGRHRRRGARAAAAVGIDARYHAGQQRRLRAAAGGPGTCGVDHGGHPARQEPAVRGPPDRPGRCRLAAGWPDAAARVRRNGVQGAVVLRELRHRLRSRERRL